MKKLSKLTLNKETIAKLEKGDMSNLKGGTTPLCYNTQPLVGCDTSENCIPDTSGECNVNTVGHDEPSCLSNHTDLVCFWCYGIA